MESTNISQQSCEADDAGVCHTGSHSSSLLSPCQLPLRPVVLLLSIRPPPVPRVIRADASSLRRMNDAQKEETEEERITRILRETTRKIKDLGRAGKPREALNTLVAMAETKVQPDTQVATALIDACARNGQMEMVRIFSLTGEFQRSFSFSQ